MDVLLSLTANIPSREADDTKRQSLRLVPRPPPAPWAWGKEADAMKIDRKMCAHRFIRVKRRASGIQIYSYDTDNPGSPWCFEDDGGDLSVPKTGTCFDCGKKMRLPEACPR